MARQEQGIERYETPGGERRYRVRWWEDGRHPSKTFRRLSGPRGARAFYQRIRQLQEAGARTSRQSEDELSLALFVAEVWGPRAKRRLAPKTWERDTNVYNRHILERLGPRPLAAIDTEVLVEWQDALEAEGVGASTVIKAISILSSIFAEAVRRSRSTGVHVNPTLPLEKPSGKRRRRPRVWGPVVVERVRYELMVNSRRINPAKKLMAIRDALLVSFTEMTGCRPGEVLALRWRDALERVEISPALSGKEIQDRTKTEVDRVAPLCGPLRADLAALRKLSGDGPDEFIVQKPGGGHWVETDWRNYRARHFVAALGRVEAGWEDWRRSLPDRTEVRESVAGLAETRPYDLGRHTHSALMLASGMSLQRLARIQGHSIRVLDETYSAELAEYEERRERIDPVAEIESARRLVWGGRDPSSGE
jgi:integrase